MLDIEKTLTKVAERHQVALQRFATYAGQERPWPRSHSDGTISERVAAQASFRWGGKG